MSASHVRLGLFALLDAVGVAFDRDLDGDVEPHEDVGGLHPAIEAVLALGEEAGKREATFREQLRTDLRAVHRPDHGARIAIAQDDAAARRLAMGRPKKTSTVQRQHPGAQREYEDTQAANPSLVAPDSLDAEQCRQWRCWTRP